MSLSSRSPSSNSSTQILREVWVLTAIAIVILGLRVVAKLRIGKFGGDDLLMAFALVSITFT